MNKKLQYVDILKKYYYLRTPYYPKIYDIIVN